jgi:hypothetical protein
MAHVLLMAAFQICDPVPLFVLVKADNLPPQFPLRSLSNEYKASPPHCMFAQVRLPHCSIGIRLLDNKLLDKTSEQYPPVSGSYIAGHQAARQFQQI